MHVNREQDAAAVVVGDYVTGMGPQEGRPLAEGASVAYAHALEISPNGTLCLRLQRGCGVRGWGDGLGTGRRGGGARARRALIVAFALTSLSPQSDTAQG